MRIDTHVHCRDGKQMHKGSIKRAFQLASKAGIQVIFDMAANTDPPTIRPKDVRRRLTLVPDDCSERYFLWMGLTSDSSQIRNAVIAHNQVNKVIGLKLFTVESGSKQLAITSLEDQSRVYEELARSGFTGDLAVHCEKKSLLRPDLWNPHSLISHSATRPKEAEIESVRDQISLLEKTGFGGTLQICHVSCPESVALIKEAKEKGLKVVCEITPHHLLWVDTLQRSSDIACYKVNPPLRSLEDVEGLRACLLRGEIDYIGTDHAPHELWEKMFLPNPPSGIPSLGLYKELVEEFLPEIGASSGLIKAMTFGNIVKTFGEKLGLEMYNDKAN